MSLIMDTVSNTHIMDILETTNCSISNITDEPIRKIKIYGVSWNLRSRRPITIENLKQYSNYSLTIKKDNLSIDELFYDYKSCKEFLTSQDTVFSSYNACIVCVKIYFKVRKITIYFRANGYYYFNGKWYKPNYELYYHIFHFFNKDSIMPNEVIEKGKEMFYRRMGFPLQIPP